MKPASKARAPAPSTRAAARRDAEDAAVELRLAIGREGLGLELARPAKIGGAEVVELLATLPGAKFPLDVSGGVARFRHRRGALQRLVVEVRARAVEAWAAPKLRGLLSTDAPEVWLRVGDGGATVGVSRDAAALAFELTATADGDTLSLTMSHARGVGLSQVPTAAAMAAMVALLSGAARREGSTFVIARAAERVARALLPDAGARAPSADGMRWNALTAEKDGWVLHASTLGDALAAGEVALRAREASTLLRDADDARARGDLAAARKLDLMALERAPKHPEVGARIAEIDRAAGGRAEAALATIADTETRAGDAAAEASRALLTGELHAEAGDRAAAIAALSRAGEIEPVPQLAARTYARAAELAHDPHEALELLDRALARAARDPRLLWTRVELRVAAGRLEDARADVQRLEAQAAGPRERYLVWKRAGEAWTRAGHRGEALVLFERALRYVPDAPEALAGVGAALVAEGRAARGAELLARAIELASRAGADAHATTLELARALADKLDDLPAAIARLRAVPHEAPEAPVARGLEGSYRAALGDLAGASLAYARLRDLAASRAGGGGAPGAAPDDEIVGLLAKAATFERDERRDLHASQRHLAVALRLRPHDAAVARAYRDVGAAIAGASAPPRHSEARSAEEPHEAPVGSFAPLRGAQDDKGDDAVVDSASPFPAVEEPTAASAVVKLEEGSEAEARAAVRVDELTHRLQADPSQEAVADELAQLLQALGRGHELLALISARLEDATPERRAELAPKARIVLQRLEKDARTEGRNVEATLFRDALDMLLK